MTDKFYSDTVADKISGDDDLEDLQKTGKGLVLGRVPEDKECPPWLATYKRYYCSNCKRGIHNTPENDLRCKRKGCECRCQTHYVGRDGKARPYGTPDDSFTKDTELKTEPANDAEIEKIIAEYHKLTGTTTQQKDREWCEKNGITYREGGTAI